MRVPHAQERACALRALIRDGLRLRTYKEGIEEGEVKEPVQFVPVAGGLCGAAATLRQKP